MPWFLCPYLVGEVELTDERQCHIAARHPDLFPRYRDRIIDTLLAPDRVRKSSRVTNVRLFSRWFGDILGGKHIIVVVMSKCIEAGRHWIVTAYITRKLTKGETEWEIN